MNFPKTYNPKEVENKIYNLWEKSGFFNPDKLPFAKKKRGKKFVVSIAPPNITGSLHMGHALENTLVDILVRKKRMEGAKVLWLPGIDHGGIATQNAVEKELKKQGTTRFELGRERFIEKVWQWKKEYGNIILDQLKKLGSSCDWSRTVFTMDEDYQEAVKKAFLHYFEKGWIYQGERPVNWCSRCRTSLSDLELEYEEKKGKLWYLRYPLKIKDERLKMKDKYIVVATTRPETMLGDTAVAVNPEDKKYKNLIGKKVILPLAEREIPIIADRLVDPEFGTGAVKVTPAHDLKDYEISLRHKLPMIQVIDKKAKITQAAPLAYRGLKVLETREKIIEDLKKLNLLEKEEDYQLSLPKCYRCGTTIEIISSKQWFLKMDNLAKKAKEAVRKGKVKFKPKNFEKIYFNWLENIRDWCISRQIWWGHKIPLKGETDVLDTWFSSALWPFATLGWPKKTRDLKEFYPNNFISSDRGIINLWHARMIFSGLEFTKKVPFETIHIHATILTKTGQRMSKSLGTGIDPLSLIERYGGDATRFGIAWQATGVQDIKFDEQNAMTGKKFCNKIWNASRFALFQIGNSEFQISDLKQIPKAKFKNQNLIKEDKIILKELNKLIKSVEKELNNFRFGQAIQALYHFFWHEFCDKYIEKSKEQMANSNSQKERERSQKILLYVLLTSLKLLHPFMPFVTEEIYQRLPLKDKKKCLMVEDWPKVMPQERKP